MSEVSVVFEAVLYGVSCSSQERRDHLVTLTSKSADGLIIKLSAHL